MKKLITIAAIITASFTAQAGDLEAKAYTAGALLTCAKAYEGVSTQKYNKYANKARQLVKLFHDTPHYTKQLMGGLLDTASLIDQNQAATPLMCETAYTKH
jgi:hypothetical protein